jgi:hypothetical protein
LICRDGVGRIAARPEQAAIARARDELTESVATSLERAPQFGSEAERRQRVRLQSIEPRKARMTDLALERERLLVKQQPVTHGSLGTALFELLEQIGRHLRAPRCLGRRETKARELAQTPLVRMRISVSRLLEGIDAALSASDVGDLPVHRTQRRLRFGRERHDVAWTEFLGAARV